MKANALTKSIRECISLYNQFHSYNLIKHRMTIDKLKGDYSGLNITATNCDTAIEFAHNFLREDHMKIKLGKVTLQDVDTGIRAPNTYSIETANFSMNRGIIAVDIYEPNKDDLYKLGIPEGIDQADLRDLFEKIKNHLDTEASEQAKNLVSHPAFKWISQGASVAESIEKITPIVSRIVSFISDKLQ